MTMIHAVRIHSSNFKYFSLVQRAYGEKAGRAVFLYAAAACFHFSARVPCARRNATSQGASTRCRPHRAVGQKLPRTIATYCRASRSYHINDKEYARCALFRRLSRRLKRRALSIRPRARCKRIRVVVARLFMLDKCLYIIGLAQ